MLQVESQNINFHFPQNLPRVPFFRSFIYPIENDNYKYDDYIGNLNNEYNNTECQIYKYALKIPSAKNNNFESIKDFSSYMRIIEEELLKTLES